jgi:hypothetical protein
MHGDCCHFRLPTKINNMMRQLQQISFSLKRKLENFISRPNPIAIAKMIIHETVFLDKWKLCVPNKRNGYA